MRDEQAAGTDGETLQQLIEGIRDEIRREGRKGWGNGLDVVLAKVQELERSLAGMTGERDDERTIAVGWERKCEELEREVAILRTVVPCSRCAGSESSDGDWFFLCRDCYEAVIETDPLVKAPR